MKASELRKIYLSVVNLYGFIYSKDLFEILKHYGIEFKKEQILKDLDNRKEKMTSGYYVQKMRGNNYLIINPFYDNDEFQKLSSEKEGKPMYFPNTFDDLLKYNDYSYKDEKEQEVTVDLYTFLKRHFDIPEARLLVIVEMILLNLKYEDLSSYEKIFDMFNYYELNFDSEKVIEKFLNVLQKVANNIRIPANNGFTPNELLKMMGPVDLNNIVLTMGPNMKQNFLDGTSDPYEYLSGLNDSELPEKVKESLRNELLEVIKEIEKIPKA